MMRRIVTFTQQFRQPNALNRAYNMASHPTSSKSLELAMRDLMARNVQNVAIVTTRMEEEAHEHGGSTPPRYHGATISSFSSVAMHPYPTVAFSLRLPSRLAVALRTSKNRYSYPITPHMTVNFLSSLQTDLALKFSRPDLFPAPFSDTQFGSTKEGQPHLHNSVGTISCVVLRSFRLDFHEPQRFEEGTSEMFIARVVRIEQKKDSECSGRSLNSPLVYYRRLFGTVDMGSLAKSKS
jgi:flavin reductase (DIM6/NTAB) family NADH-FMN oxidoreductase RutF